MQKTAVLQAHGYTCHVCGHDEATQVDHIVNVARGGTDDPENLAPIHGTSFGADPCPTCGQRCHFVKTQTEAQAKRRARRERRLERHPGLLGVPGGGTPSPG